MLAFFDYESQRARINKELDKSIMEVFRHGRFILGPEVSKLESKLIEYTGAAYCITCANGTDALHIALLAAGIGRGDEVIIPAFTYIAPAEVIKLIGAIPVYVDVCPNDFTVKAEAIESKITNKTKAIIAVSLYGQPANFSKLAEIENKYGITIIEDAAQSFGAEHHNKKSCNLSTIACTSFFPSKPLGCYGDGGAIFTSDFDIANKLRLIARHGQNGRYNHVSLGMNSRLDTLQAAILLNKLKILDSEIKLRQQKAEYFCRAMQAVEDNSIKVPQLRQENTSSWAQYTTICQNREKLTASLRLNEIPFAIHYPRPIFQQRAYNENVTDCINSIELSQCVLSLPINAYTEYNEIDNLCDVLLDNLS